MVPLQFVYYCRLIRYVQTSVDPALKQRYLHCESGQTNGKFRKSLLKCFEIAVFSMGLDSLFNLICEIELFSFFLFWSYCIIVPNWGTTHN